MQDRTDAHAIRHERERLLEAEKSAREAAERSRTVKSQFLSVISHELRTPLTAVLGYYDLLQTDVVGPMNPRQKDYLGRVKASALHLVTIIDEILTSPGSRRAGKRCAPAAPTPLL
jgi:two-component system, cell cycle sensor histidine kinase PleC